MNVESVEKMAELLRRRSLVAIEFEFAGQSISLVASPTRSVKTPATVSESSRVATPAGGQVQSPGMGFIRLSHPQRQDERLSSGDCVERGQVVAWLEDDGLLTEISATQPGVVGQIRVQEGERVGYAHVLIEYR